MNKNYESSDMREMISVFEIIVINISISPRVFGYFTSWETYLGDKSIWNKMENESENESVCKGDRKKEK